MDASSDEIWKGVKNKYWHLPMYMVPTCKLPAPRAEPEEAGAPEQD